MGVEANQEACAVTRPRDMSSLTCVHCLGSGWACENHMDRPSDVITEGGCDCGAAAAPCRCNPAAVFELEEVYASVEDPESTSGSRWRNAQISRRQRH